MRLLWAQYGDESGTPANVIEQLCRDELNVEVKEYLDAVVYGTEDVAMDSLLEHIGVSQTVQTPLSLQDKGGDEAAGKVIVTSPVNDVVDEDVEELAAVKLVIAFDVLT